MPHVSICIPSYNRVGLVSQAIESALSQTETDVEVILIDDGSTDGTLGVAARYADSRFRIEKNACRLGLSGNMNRCLELASGTYVKILCDDDLLYPESVARLAAGLDRFPEATFATSAWAWIDGAGSFLRSSRLLPSAPAEGVLVDLRRVIAMSRLYRNGIGSPTEVLLRRSAMSGLGFDGSYPQMMDWHLWLRLLQRGSLVFFPQILSAIRSHEPSQSARNHSLAQSADDLLGISAELQRKLPELHGAVSKFELSRLQVLCLLRATQIALGNVARGDWHKVATNLSVAKRAIGMLFKGI